MTQTSRTNKIVATFFALAMAFGVFFITSVTTASAATDRVSMYSISPTFSKYGFTSYEVYIRTNDNAQEQNVTVHYYYVPSSDWQDTEATYVTTLNDGSKIWRANFSSLDCQYVIKYEADGEIIWDNNDGHNYNRSELIGTAPIEALRYGYQYDMDNYKVGAVLKNFAYNKNVFVRYTTDGWNTYSDAALAYDDTNDDGTENWSTTLSLGEIADSEDFEYAICYQVNGQVYWANNFGDNYDFNDCIHH